MYVCLPSGIGNVLRKKPRNKTDFPPVAELLAIVGLLKDGKIRLMEKADIWLPLNDAKTGKGTDQELHLQVAFRACGEYNPKCRALMVTNIPTRWALQSDERFLKTLEYAFYGKLRQEWSLDDGPAQWRRRTACPGLCIVDHEPRGRKMYGSPGAEEISRFLGQGQTDADICKPTGCICPGCGGNFVPPAGRVVKVYCKDVPASHSAARDVDASATTWALVVLADCKDAAAFVKAKHFSNDEFLSEAEKFASDSGMLFRQREPSLSPRTVLGRSSSGSGASLRLLMFDSFVDVSLHLS